MRELERRVVLSVLDRKWREHLYEMDYLQEGIGLRAMAQRDPLVEYQREGFDMFAAMMEGIKEESVGFLFNLEVQVEDAPPSRARPTGEARTTSSSPRASRPRASGRSCSTPRRPWTATSTRRRTTACTAERIDASTATSRATPRAPAARARSTSAATATRGRRPAERARAAERRCGRSSCATTAWASRARGRTSRGRATPSPRSAARSSRSSGRTRSASSAARTREEADEWLARFPDDASVMPYIGRSGWNTLRIGGAIPDEDLLEAVDASYDTVVAKLPRRERP